MVAISKVRVFAVWGHSASYHALVARSRFRPPSASPAACGSPGDRFGGAEAILITRDPEA